MKYIKYIFLTTIIIFVVYVLFSLISTRYRNYRITDISIRPVHIYGSEKLNKKRQYYILEFITERCNPHKVFMQGPIRFVEDNIIQNINSITISDSSKSDITDKFKGWKCESFGMSKYYCKYPPYYYSFSDIHDMVHAINDFTEGRKHHSREEYERQGRFRINFQNSVLFYTESDKALPKSIKIIFSTYTIEKKMIEPVVKDTFYIYSKDFSEIFYKNLK